MNKHEINDYDINEHNGNNDTHDHNKNNDNLNSSNNNSKTNNICLRLSARSAHPSWDLGACLIALSVCYVIVSQCRGCTLSASKCVSPAG